ncbi:unnamed protein product [Rangifer tarandus platyrhynchus]|uniref:Uncharacterized protein n=2 Tax=Rangifer tarandus platyrhynchus TaxID=3082113 RepID=A0ABN8YVW2_RANTA|nr:unnamed protein product [Rangifer tarandus platyrhynchus]
MEAIWLQSTGLLAVTSPGLEGAQAGDTRRLISWYCGGAALRFPLDVSFSWGVWEFLVTPCPAPISEGHASGDKASGAQGSNTKNQASGQALHFCVIERILVGNRGLWEFGESRRGLFTSSAQRQTCNSLLSAGVTANQQNHPAAAECGILDQGGEREEKPRILSIPCPHWKH